MSEATHEIEIPESALATLGAADSAEFFIKLAASVVRLKNTVAAHAEAIGSGEILTEAAIREIATTAGSAEAAKALGACGVTPPAPPSAAVKVTTANANPAKQRRDLLKAGNYKEVFEADEKIRAEFGELEVFEAYMKAKRGGQIIN